MTKNVHGVERGSISPLIITYFVITLFTIFVISNVAFAYSARRDLIAVSEAALTRATEELDLLTYYTGVASLPSYESGKRRTPIDCFRARATFSLLLEQEISIRTFECNGYELRSAVTRIEKLPFQFPIFGIDAFTNDVEIAAASEYRD